MKKMKMMVLTAAMGALATAFAATPFGVDNFYSDHMILQRDKPVRVSGSATPGETVTVSLAEGYAASAAVGANGRWNVTLPPRHRGGPYTMTVKLEKREFTKIEFEDVWFGEVWVCSGQSNMEYPMIGDAMYYQHPFGRAIADKADDRLLRAFLVPRSVSAGVECTDFPGRPSWKPMVGRDAFKGVSAVAYFFARKLREELGPDVPVGIVSASWGGTLIEPWIPYAAYAKYGFRSQAAEAETARLQASAGGLDQKQFDERNAEFQRKLVEWVNGKFLNYAPKASREAIANWGKVEVDRSQWKIAPRAKMTGLQAPGVAWYRFEFDLDDSWAKANLKFHVDAVNDCDETYFDGVKIGETRVEDGGEYWAKSRDYAFKGPGKAGRHVIAIRAMDHRDWGEIRGRVMLQNVDSGEIKPLDQGDWMERVEFRVDTAKIGERPPTPQTVSPIASTANGVPTTLFNAMIAPATCAAVRGAIWYQGCSNAHMGERYADFQRALIKGWRDAWNDPELAFVITQLSAFQTHSPGRTDGIDDFWKGMEPKDCIGYGPVRKGQDACHTFYKTGVACTIDIGEAFDIHPNNKEEVGARLANEALRIAYGRAECLPGPRFAKATRKGSKVEIAFKDAGEELALEGGRLNPHLVALAGADGVFHWGEGKLQDDRLVVWCDKVAKPERVQYCHSAYPPNVNLSRTGDGYPVFPFDEKVD